MNYRIYLSPPHMGGKEIEYINEAFSTNWIAPAGPAIDSFEEEMAQYIGVESALALTSGTAGIHLALRWYGVGPGDVIFCSDFTFIGSCSPILYERCSPVFIDSEPESWNMSPVALEDAFKWAALQGKLPKAVIIVDLYGESADWDRLLPICHKYAVPVIEDAAEAVGTVYNGKRCGSFGDISVLSFNGNKIITTSGGGMVLSSNKAAIEKMRFWSTQAREPFIHYEHIEYGYNYRMSNICACIGRGQLAYLPEKMIIRKMIHDNYQTHIGGPFAHIKRVTGNNSNYWLNILVLDYEDFTPSKIICDLMNNEIESRPTWKPMHLQPLFKDAKFFPLEEFNGISISEFVFSRSVCLPSGDGMTENDQHEVIKVLNRSLYGV